MTERNDISRAGEPRRHRRRGHTLLELVISLSLYAIVFGVVASMMVLMARAASRDADGCGVEGQLLALRMTAELRQALSFSKRLDHEVEFTVPDRNGDGVSDKLRYRWSGTPGDSLYFHFNDTVEVVAQVQLFDLGYEFISPTSLPLDEELAVLRYHDDPPEGHFHDRKIEDSKWVAQYVAPVFPGGVTPTFWKIKRVRLMAKIEGDATGVLEVRVTTADAQLQPTATILDVAMLPESELDKEFSWVSVDFTSLNDLDPAQGVCIVVAQAPQGGSAGKIHYSHGGNPMTAGTHWMKSDNAGTSWESPDPSKDMRFFVYGTYDNYSPQPRQFVGGVQLALQLDCAAADPVDARTLVLNAPEVQQP